MDIILNSRNLAEYILLLPSEDVQYYFNSYDFSCFCDGNICSIFCLGKCQPKFTSKKLTLFYCKNIIVLEQISIGIETNL